MKSTIISALTISSIGIYEASVFQSTQVGETICPIPYTQVCASIPTNLPIPEPTQPIGADRIMTAVSSATASTVDSVIDWDLLEINPNKFKL